MASAQSAWGHLTLEEREQAARAAPVCVQTLQRRKARIPALTSYLRDRVFLDFVDAPEIDLDGDFLITPDRPEWSAWLADVRRHFGEKGVERVVRLRKLVRKDRWPPAKGTRGERMEAAE